MRRATAVELAVRARVPCLPASTARSAAKNCARSAWISETRAGHPTRERPDETPGGHAPTDGRFRRSRLRSNEEDCRERTNDPGAHDRGARPNDHDLERADRHADQVQRLAAKRQGPTVRKHSERGTRKGHARRSVFVEEHAADTPRERIDHGLLHFVALARHCRASVKTLGLRG